MVECMIVIMAARLSLSTIICRSGLYDSTYPEMTKKMSTIDHPLHGMDKIGSQFND